MNKNKVTLFPLGPQTV